MRTVELPVQPYQAEAFTDWETPIIGVAAGKRSGKTHVITVMKSIVAATLHPGTFIVVASPTYGMTRRNILPLYRSISKQLGIEIEGLASGGTERKAPTELRIKTGSSYTTIYLDITVENYGRMNGMSLSNVFVDEIDKARPQDAAGFLEEATIRLSKPAPGRVAQLHITGAPELNGYMAEYFMENPSPRKKLFTWSMMENMAISAEYKQAQLELIPPSKQAGWIYGNFMFNSDGLVYDEYDPEENHIDFTMKDVALNEPIYVTWDINDGGTNAYLGVRRGNHMILFEEWPKLKGTEEVLERVKKTTWANRAIVTCDPACTQVFPYIVKSGISHKIMNSHPEIEWRVTAVNNRLGTKSKCLWDGEVRRHLLINKLRCRILNKCLMRQGYEKGEPQKGSKYWVEEAGTDISGPLDGVGYLVYLLFPYNPRSPGKQVVLRY